MDMEVFYLVKAAHIDIFFHKRQGMQTACAVYEQSAVRAVRPVRNCYAVKKQTAVMLFHKLKQGSKSVMSSLVAACLEAHLSPRHAKLVFRFFHIRVKNGANTALSLGKFKAAAAGVLDKCRGGNGKITAYFCLYKAVFTASPPSLGSRDYIDTVIHIYFSF